ncbi:cadherin domain-containing protein [Novosphingobium sp. SG720]|uniref:calcium-binding protein n=1 Tax=Novosphingobium sp. SG720 TaxID=2586998 RepID=UPI0014458AEA|nr:cadherin domain-containing protein [Novosphingobium sp. SG720]NKJ43557.1 hypothetical protein [Novosphingobium sp. SG720]
MTVYGKQGTAFLIPTATTNIQNQPAIATLADGRVVVVWTDLSKGVGGATGDTSDNAIKGQILAANGSKLGSEFLINTATSGGQTLPTIASLANGGFIVTWTDASAGVGGAGGDTSGKAIKAQIFDATGAEVGSEIRINARTVSDQFQPSVASLAGGGYVITWTDTAGAISGTGADTSEAAVKARIYDANGAKVGGEFLVNTQIIGSQADAHVTGLANGTFVITWTDSPIEATLENPYPDTTTADGDMAGIKAQLYAANGTPIGGEMIVNTSTYYYQTKSTVTALANGGYVVAWESWDGYGPADNTPRILAQVFDAGGAKVGAELAVSTPAGIYMPEWPTIAALANGGFVIVYDKQLSGGNAITARAFDALGHADGAEIAVTGLTTWPLYDPVVTGLADGGFMVSWTDYNQGGTTPGDTSIAVKGQVFTVVGHDPMITSNGADATASVVIAENNTVVTTVTATDADPGTTIRYALAGGADAALFQINATTGVLSFKSSPDFENPTDANRNGVYDVIVSARDGTYTDTQAIAVTVSDVFDSMVHTTRTALVRVNAETPGEQIGPTLAATTDGMIAAWVDSNTLDLRAQFLAADGSRVGSEITVATLGVGPSTDNGVTMAQLAGGNIVLAWTDANRTIKAQLITANGTLVGDAFSLAATPSLAGSPRKAAIATLADGGFVATWEAYAGADSSGTAVRAQLFDASGNKVGAEIAVNTATNGNQADPAIATLAKGGFVITWNDSSATQADTDGTAVKAQVFSSSGVKLGNEFQVNTHAPGNQDHAVVARLANGTFVVSWQDRTGVDDSLTAIKAQLFNASGARLGTEILVSTTDSASDAVMPAITPMANGGFAIAWNDSGPAWVMVQLFYSTGAKAGSAFKLSADAINSDLPSALAGLADGSLASVWQTHAAELGDTDGGIALHVDTVQTPSGSVTITGSAAPDVLNGTFYNDKLLGGDGADKLNGGSGTDTLVGGAGDDRLYGGDGSDTASYAGAAAGVTVSLAITTAQDTIGAGTDTLNSIENLGGSSFADHLTGGSGNNYLVGGNGNDVLDGGAGNDLLVGSAGADTMTGGTGNDRFRFDVMETTARRDTITDFTAGQDSIEIRRSIFTAFAGHAAGALTAGELALGPVATTPDQHLIYDQSTGVLSYDADGSGAGAAIELAVLTGHPALVAGDILLI